MTVRLDLDDASLRAAAAIVVRTTTDAIVLNRTPFYPRSGGQPGDTGTLSWSGHILHVLDTRKGEGDEVLHIVKDGSTMPAEGCDVRAELDWTPRLAHMRMHTALHLLCSLLPGAAVTGGQIGAEKSRLDFDLPAAPDKDFLEAGFAALVAAANPVATEWVDETVLDSNPSLVRTLSVQPPRGTGRLRLVRIGTVEDPVDLQPCGGTHVPHTGLIGRVRVLKIENKGKQNRRISLGLED